MIKIISKPEDLIELRSQIEATKTIGFVPTMGAIHAGHLSLIEKSIGENDICIISIFVNKTQFNDKDDFDNYPSSLDDDIKKINQIEFSDSKIILFTPKMKDMYPDNYSYKLSESIESNFLCGAKRPGHFDGVLTIVMKLLILVSADKAYFGEKDFQQLELIKGMSRAFFLRTDIIPCPIIRDEDGLALSSRNKLLSPENLTKAKQLNKILKSNKSSDRIERDLALNGFEIDYIHQKENRIFVAVKLGEVRLIDNLER